MGRFDERVALVTGAGSPDGIGFATARLLGSGGARVAVTATTDRIVDRAEQLQDEGVDAAGFTADLTDEQQARGLVRAVETRFGRLDVLVNNAGMVQSGLEGVWAPFVDLSASAFGHHLGLNLWTAFFVTRAALPGMIERGYGRIVMVSSVTRPVVTNPARARQRWTASCVRWRSRRPGAASPAIRSSPDGSRRARRRRKRRSRAATPR